MAPTSSVSAIGARDRTISFYNIHSKETLTIQYMKAGKRVPEAMDKINWILRDWRKDETTTIDPDLIDLVWEIHAELGSAEPIHIISGFRSRATNELLRRTVGGQASESRHILGKAMDVHFPDVPVRKLRYSALIRERGGVGYYPASAIPFVHIDTDRVRAWPRLPRDELALLFPSGRTQHLPEDGEPITKDDVRRVQASKSELVERIAEFHAERARLRTPVQIASLTPSLPRLMSPPQLAARPQSQGTNPSDRDRQWLTDLASGLPRLVRGPTPARRVASPSESGADPMTSARVPLPPGATADLRRTVVSAPTQDEEHPDELSYRPFPIAPLLTATASPDSPFLARLVPPDLGKALETIDERGTAQPRLRLSSRAAQMMLSQQLMGEAVDLAAMTELEVAEAAARQASRRVAIQPK